MCKAVATHRQLADARGRTVQGCSVLAQPPRKPSMGLKTPPTPPPSCASSCCNMQMTLLEAFLCVYTVG